MNSDNCLSYNKRYRLAKKIKLAEVPGATQENPQHLHVTDPGTDDSTSEDDSTVSNFGKFNQHHHPDYDMNIVGSSHTDLDWEISSISDAESDSSAHSLETEYFDTGTSTSSSDSDEDDNDFPQKTAEIPNIYPGCQLNVRQSAHLVSSLQLRHNLTNAATQDILKLIKLHLPITAKYPHTTRRLERTVELDMSWVTRAYYCMTCFVLLPLHMQCHKCKTVYAKGSLAKSGKYFLNFDVKKQLELILQSPEAQDHILKGFEKRMNPTSVRGTIYDTLCLRPHDITCTFNYDGVSVFRSSRKSIWPILVSINELPFHLRKKHIIMPVLWFGEKPKVHLYFPSFVKQFNQLSVAPLTWTNRAGDSFESRIQLIICTADAVARCVAQGLIQFNGEFGCTWCLNPGVVVKKGKGRCRVYTGETSTLRTATEFKNAVLSSQFTSGINSASPLLLLNQFDIIHGFSVDSMHCVFMGVVKAFCKLWMETCDAEYYLGRRLKEVDNILLTVKVPSEIPRVVNSISNRKYWKASEWRTWLFIIPVVLKSFLPHKFLEHFNLLSDSIFALSKEHVQLTDIVLADRKLPEFVKGVEKFYGVQHMSFNVHQLTHLPGRVRRLGALWETSAFLFESYNGKIVKYVKSSCGVASQVGNKFLLEIQLRNIPLKSFGKNDEAKTFFANMLSINDKHTDDCAKYFMLVNYDSLPKIVQLYISDNIVGYREITMSNTGRIGYKFRSNDTSKRSNNLFLLGNCKLGRLTNFYNVSCSCQTQTCDCCNSFIVVNTFNVKLLEGLSYIFYCESNCKTEVEIHSVKTIVPHKFFTLSLGDRNYFISVPNLFEVD